MNNLEMMKQLQMPFKPDEIEWRVGSTNGDKSKGLALAYVTNRAIQNRLDEVFGPLGWQNQYREWKSTSQICGISVYDQDKQQWITKWDGADDSATEAVKGGLSDSMKRAAYQWGIGRYLYNLPQTWVPLKSGKYLEYEPQLPDWALPDGYKYKNMPQNTGGSTNSQPSEKSDAKSNLKPVEGNTACTCSLCNKPITEDVRKFSVDRFKRPLCRACQNNHKVAS